jgi:hypothetical protein
MYDILAYLSENPAAEDSIEGIAEWWLLQQRVKERVPQIQQAISKLVEKGLVIERKSRGSRARYRINRRRKRAISLMLKDRPGDCDAK